MSRCVHEVHSVLGVTGARPMLDCRPVGAGPQHCPVQSRGGPGRRWGSGRTRTSSSSGLWETLSRVFARFCRASMTVTCMQSKMPGFSGSSLRFSFCTCPSRWSTAASVDADLRLRTGERLCSDGMSPPCTPARKLPPRGRAVLGLCSGSHSLKNHSLGLPLAQILNTAVQIVCVAAGCLLCESHFHSR